jgi:hypothetical protein
MTRGAATLAATPTAERSMINGFATALEPILGARAMPARAGAAQRATSPLRALLARLRALLEDHGDYFAELERSLPPHERERRQARRDADRLVPIATLMR